MPIIRRCFALTVRDTRTEALPFDGAIFGFDLHGDTAYLIAMKDMKLQEIYEANLKTGGMRAALAF